MLDTEKTEFKKALKQYKHSRKIKECFYHNKEECKGSIKQAHSIQKNKRLSIIDELVDNNRVLYTFTEFETGTVRFIKTLIPIGKSNASTFFGFCDKHDTELFSTIENKEFDGSDEHCFLHSYRSFAHSYHRKKEERKGVTTNNPVNNSYTDEYKEQWLKGNEYAISDLDYYRKDLDVWIEKKDYSQLEYFTVVFPELFPIACSSLISPFYSLRGKAMNNHSDPSIPWSAIMLTVLPDFTQTIVIFACFPNDESGIRFLDELTELNDYKFKKVLTSILIFFSENTFFSPSLWNRLGTSKQRILCDEIEKGIKLGFLEMPNQFEYAKLNLFDDRYSYERLENYR